MWQSGVNQLERRVSVDTVDSISNTERMTQPAAAPPLSSDLRITRAMVGPQTDTHVFTDALTQQKVRLVRYPSPNFLGLLRL